MEETMKCLKDTQTGDILRVSDLEAFQKAGNRFQYVPKSEWKKTRPTVSVKQAEEVEKKEETVSEKALRRKKLGDKQRPAEDLDNRLK
jgi:hypothetical protein